jgi:hypothetical protein
VTHAVDLEVHHRTYERLAKSSPATSWSCAVTATGSAMGTMAAHGGPFRRRRLRAVPRRLLCRARDRSRSRRCFGGCLRAETSRAAAGGGRSGAAARPRPIPTARRTIEPSGVRVGMSSMFCMAVTVAYPGEGDFKTRRTPARRVGAGVLARDRRRGVRRPVCAGLRARISVSLRSPHRRDRRADIAEHPPACHSAGPPASRARGRSAGSAARARRRPSA